MKVLNFRNLFLSVSFLALSGASSVTKDDDLEKKFDDWVAKYDKQYSTEEEKLKRLQIWSENYGTSRICTVLISCVIIFSRISHSISC